MGEGLIKARQPRDASERLEEAVDLYRELLGQNHIDSGRAVNALAKSLVKVIVWTETQGHCRSCNVVTAMG